MHLERSILMAALAALAALAACGGSGVIGDDDGGAGAHDGGEVDGGATCGAPVTTFADGLTPTAELHVAPGGDDGSGDGSPASPFATIGRAAQAAAPGTAIRVHPGTYAADNYVAGLAGTAEAPIWIGGVPGMARPVLSGGAQGLHLVRPRYVVVHDLEVTGAAQNGVNADDGGDVDDPTAAHHVVFQGLHIHGVGADGNQDCLKLSGLRDFWVLSSELADCGDGGSGVDHVGCHRGVLAGNTFRDTGANAVQVKGGSADIEIRGNRLIDAGARALNLGGSTGYAFFRPPLSDSAPNAEARRVHAVANLIEGSTAPVAFVGCVDCLFAGNTVIDPETWVLRILQETSSDGTYDFEPASGGRFVNNLVYFRRDDLSTFVNVGAGTDAPSFVFSHNLWYAHDDPDQSAPTLPSAETGPIIGADPALDADRRIDASSPAAGAGIALAELGADLDGRCYRMPPSIGAFEIPDR